MLVVEYKLNFELLNKEFFFMRFLFELHDDSVEEFDIFNILEDIMIYLQFSIKLSH